MRLLHCGVVILFASSACSRSSGPAPAPVDIGTQKQLFADDYIIASTDKAFRIFNQPVKHQGNPIIELKPPQKVGGKELVIASGTVMYDQEERLFKMWYEAADYHWTNNPVCYATSKDGIRWDLPRLGLYQHEGSRDNNIVFRSDQAVRDTSPAVLKDPVAKDPQQRYKMLYKRGPKSTDGLRAALSPDGIHWTPGPDAPLIPYTDSPVSMIWDRKLARYVAHTRHNAHYGSILRREVLQSESEDFAAWKPHGVIMKADDQDAPWNRQFYNMEWMSYEDVYFGFISVYHILPGMEPKVPPGVPWLDKVDIQLAFSRDGRGWQRAGDRQVFIPNGASAADFDHAMIYVMQHPIVVGDEIWVYYAGFSGDHWATRRNEVQGGAVGLAKLRLDGFVSVDAGEGTLTTRLLQMSGDRLVINANASLGSVRVEVLDSQGRPMQGFTKEDADPITGDNVRHTATWKGNPDIKSLKGRPIALKFHIDRSRLYSFVFRESS